MRRRLNRAFNTFERAKFEFVQAVVMAIEVGDIVACRTAGRTNGDRKFKSSLRPPRTGPKAEIKDRLEYYWKVSMSATQALGLVCWCEWAVTDGLYWGLRQCQARRYIMRMLSVLFWFTSFVLVLAECTIWCVGCILPCACSCLRHSLTPARNQVEPGAQSTWQRRVYHLIDD